MVEPVQAEADDHEIMIILIIIIIAYFEDIILCVKLSNFLNAFLFKLKILQKKYNYYPHFAYKNIKRLNNLSQVTQLINDTEMRF